MNSEFSKKVYEVVRGIPKGQTLTYGEVARLAGNPGAARAVGNILSKNYDPKIPCHRVIRKMGAFGGYRWGMPRKKAILGWEMARNSRAVEWTGA